MGPRTAIMYTTYQTTPKRHKVKGRINEEYVKETISNEVESVLRTFIQRLRMQLFLCLL